MNTSLSNRFQPRGFTLIEMSIVIFVLLALMTSGFYASNVVGEWKLARDASENLRDVYVAQRTYLADNPTVPVTSLTPALLLPYMPNNPAAMPTSKSLDSSTLYARVNVSPPYLTTNSSGTDGTRYDPSKTTTDSQWDVGE
jgi:prepilin-type N-terminal cleavage/methylation domain-containing protein